jgi:hypothetical protein
MTEHHWFWFLSLPLKITMGYIKFPLAGFLETVRYFCTILTKILFFQAFLYSYGYQSSWNNVSIRVQLFHMHLQTYLLPTTVPIFIKLITFACFNTYTSGGIKWTGRKIVPNSPWNWLSSKLESTDTFPHQVQCIRIGNIGLCSPCHKYAWSAYTREPPPDITKYCWQQE